MLQDSRGSCWQGIMLCSFTFFQLQAVKATNTLPQGASLLLVEKTHFILNALNSQEFSVS